MELLCVRIWGSQRFPLQSGGRDSKFETLRLTKQKLEATSGHHSLAWSSSSCVSSGLGHVATEPLKRGSLLLGKPNLSKKVPSFAGGSLFVGRSLALGHVATEPLGTRVSFFGGRWYSTSTSGASSAHLNGTVGGRGLVGGPGSSSELERPGLLPPPPSSHAIAGDGVGGAGTEAAS